VETDETEKYLRGETLEKDIENGWCLVTHKGYPLGLGKAVNGVIKNHLPKGLRKV
jgi:NOL1/NOP2/fmu family ribosome biogenesis protein